MFVKRTSALAPGTAAAPAPSAARRALSRATAASNGEILTRIRAIVERSLAQLDAASTEAPLSKAQTQTLYTLARTYSLLDASTSREHSRYDFSAMSDSELEAFARSLG